MIGLLAGVTAARSTGRGCDVDVNLYDSALAMLSYPATWLLSAGIETERLPSSAHPSIVPFQFFRTSDGHVAVACAKQHFFEALARGIGLAAMLDDPRFGDFEARLRNREALTSLIEDRLQTDTTRAWVAQLRGRVPIAPVRSLSEAADASELADRTMLASYHHPRLGHVRSIGSPIHVDGWEPTYRPGPALGGDEDDIQAELDRPRVHSTEKPPAGGGNSGSP
jgi:crotonobetainyl-CoA:carnitine CoA-transferase CaiB-like acyl-CoA transferase